MSFNSSLKVSKALSCLPKFPPLCRVRQLVIEPKMRPYILSELIWWLGVHIHCTTGIAREVAPVVAIYKQVSSPFFSFPQFPGILLNSTSAN